jgi:hypothetical protein
MTRGSFQPATPALEADSVGDDADEDEDHSDQHDEVGGVLGQRERTDPWIADVRQVVLDEIEEQAEGDDDRADLREARDRRPRWRGGWRGRGIDRHGHHSYFYR